MTKMKTTKPLVKPSPKRWANDLSKLDRSKSVREKFRDFCEMAYCAYAKLTAPNEDRAEQLEDRYMHIVGTYKDKDSVRAYPKLLAEATTATDFWGMDFLGQVAGEINALDAKQGQFFTPMEVSRLMAQMTLANIKSVIERQGFFTLSEPAAGAGGMVLACADEVERQGFNLQHHMLVHTMDINMLAFHMCYLQLTFKGVPAYVERANALSLEHFDGAWTLPALEFYRVHGHFFPETMKRDNAEPVAEAINKVPEQAYDVPMKQLSLWGDGS